MSEKIEPVEDGVEKPAPEFEVKEVQAFIDYAEPIIEKGSDGQTRVMHKFQVSCLVDVAGRGIRTIPVIAGYIHGDNTEEIVHAHAHALRVGLRLGMQSDKEVKFSFVKLNPKKGEDETVN